MTMSNYSNAIVDVMLGWLKGLANWVLRLFNLAGSVSGSPLLWLSHNWLKLLIFFLVLGVVLDRLVWLIRWRPYWVWFRKERIIVNDDKLFASAELDPDAEWNEDLQERDYVVASTVVKRREGGKTEAAASGNRRPARKRTAPTTRVRRRKVEHGKPRAQAAQPVAASTKVRRHDDKRPPARDIFGEKLKRAEVADSYEDEVFNVSNLPVSDEFTPDGKSK